MKIIAYILSAILIFFGVLFIWASLGGAFNAGTFLTGVITVGIGFLVLWFISRKKSVSPEQNSEVTLKIDLPANVKLESLKCQSCGGSLSAKDIHMLAGAPVVNCPYCKSSYQLTEEPKW
jgi:hypothetical protein